MIAVKHISRRFDEAAVLASLAKVAFEPSASLNDQDLAVLAALRRSSPEWAELSVEETSARLAGYDEDQIAGLVNNTKGILHEMEFQRLENEDGDSVFAALYPDTNHRAVDVQMLDRSSGESWSLQLKATDDPGAINAWMAANPDTEILVTDELAEKMDLPSSGQSNDDLTMRVEDFVDRMLEFQNDPSLWDHFPVLVVASSGIIVFELWRRYRSGEMAFEQFRDMTIKTLGLKAAKYVTLFSALAVPGLNVVVGAYLLASLILNVSDIAGRASSFRPFAFLRAD
ncbi:hypothetical protein [Thiorhodovibrio frisius]|uniref:Uncharacterized protein n=1 Tax=Thiorhodovibrio frisius TaxID=631362 RepID=H8Z1B3_9GAMM|nr:hypothetical protein [Thiorhodovibrio frisius]EIC21428.1 hypothetical protein Thi970DRAFT_01636 [Thiorhodovibrio frisius]WPL24014.1 hypothetical protein Thiofri_04225 [Thiorhodovibrio frisius]